MWYHIGLLAQGLLSVVILHPIPYAPQVSLILTAALTL